MKRQSISVTKSEIKGQKQLIWADLQSYILCCEYHRALSLYSDSLSIYAALEQRKDQAIAIEVNIGYIYQRLEQYELAISNYEQAIQISRDIGYSRGEGSNLGNLGTLYLNMEQWDRAEQALISAIEVCRSTYSLAAGSFMGSLAGLYAQQLKFEEAKELLLEGEPLVEVYPEEYGKFLCKKATVLHLTEQSDLAKDAFDKAKGIAKDINSGEQSEFHKLIVQTAEMLDALPKEASIDSSPEQGECIVETDPFQVSGFEQAESTKTSTTETSSVMIPAEDIEAIKRQADLLQEQGEIEEAEATFELAIEKYQQAWALYSKIEKMSKASFNVKRNVESVINIWVNMIWLNPILNRLLLYRRHMI